MKRFRAHAEKLGSECQSRRDNNTGLTSTGSRPPVMMAAHVRPLHLAQNQLVSRRQGLRYQALLIMEPYWVQQKVEMPKPQFDAHTLGDYVGQCMKNGGAVTINLGIYQDGSVDPRTVDVPKEVGQGIRKEQK
jgi:hypothetical protein